MTQNLHNISNKPAAQRAQVFGHIGSRTLVAAQVSKLREGNATHHQANAPSQLMASTAQSDMLQISQEQQIRIIDNENALTLMPEIEWASRVLVSSILSPKDMTKRELLYSIDIDWIPSNVAASILEEVKQEMVRTYDYANSLYAIFKDCLFVKGSHPRLIMPEAAVDRVINSGETLNMESLSNFFDKESGHLKRKGFFGRFTKKTRESETINMESFVRANASKADSVPDEHFFVPDGKDEKGDTIYAPDGLITVTDNVDAIKLPFYLDAISAASREELLGMPDADFGDFDFGVEIPTQEGNAGFTKDIARAKNSGLTAREFRSATYKSAPSNMVTHLRIPGQDELKRRSVGRPLVASLPAEAVVPVIVPGDPRRKLGYILLIDEVGHPVSLFNSSQLLARAAEQFNTLNQATTAGTSASASSIISKAARNLTGGTPATSFRDAAKIFEQLVEDNIIPRLMDGGYPGGAEIGESSNLYMLMLARTLCSMRTRLVFVPSEMLTYFAFDFHNNGVGKSLLDANKALISIRAGLLLTRMTGEIRNSIPLTKITMKIDEDDADWEKTLAETEDIVSKTRQPQFPLSTLAVNDLMDWINRAGFIFAFEGHPRIPDTGFQFEKINHENPLPDQEFYDSLGKQLYMGFGIPPELMDSTYNPEFAIAVASRNIMFTQTILEYQKIASSLITSDHHRLILADGEMINMIVGLIRSKWGDITSRLPAEEKEQLSKNPQRFATSLVKRIVTSIRVSLPTPDATTLENQHERLTQFTDLLDTLFDSFVSESVISGDLAPELSQKIGTMRETVKAAMIRQWCADNNVMPELFDLSSVDEEGRPAFDLLGLTESYTQGLITNFMAFAKAMVSQDAAAKQDSETLNLGNEGGGGGSFSSSSNDSGGGGGDDFGGGFGDFADDFGGGDDVTTTDTSTETTSTDTPPADGGGDTGGAPAA